MMFRRILFFLTGLGILFLILHAVAPADIMASVRALDWRYAAAAFVAYLGVNVARVERMSILVRGRVRRAELYPFIFFQNFLNVFFSFSGDAAYLSLIHRTGKITPGDNAASFFAAKALDAAALAGVFLGAVFFISSPLILPLRFPALILFLSVGTAWIVMFVRPRTMARGIARAAEMSGLARSRRAARFLEEVQRIADGLSLFNHGRAGAGLAWWTAVNWFCTFLAGGLLLRGAHVVLGVTEILFAYAFPIAAGLTPLYVFGGFGSYEGSFVAGLVLVGIDIGRASAAAIVIHIQELGFLVVCVVLGALIRMAAGAGTDATGSPNMFGADKNI
jgi:uncharacterized membrane protein YbhN (UPF0104 family)